MRCFGLRACDWPRFATARFVWAPTTATTTTATTLVCASSFRGEKVTEQHHELNEREPNKEHIQTMTISQEESLSLKLSQQIEGDQEVSSNMSQSDIQSARPASEDLVNDMEKRVRPEPSEAGKSEEEEARQSLRCIGKDLRHLSEIFESSNRRRRTGFTSGFITPQSCCHRTERGLWLLPIWCQRLFYHILLVYLWS